MTITNRALSYVPQPDRDPIMFRLYHAKVACDQLAEKLLVEDTMKQYEDYRTFTRNTNPSILYDDPYPTVLHIGCGTGDLCIELQQRYPDWKFIGLDNDRDSLTHARENAWQQMGENLKKPRIKIEDLNEEELRLAQERHLKSQASLGIQRQSGNVLPLPLTTSNLVAHSSGVKVKQEAPDDDDDDNQATLGEAIFRQELLLAKFEQQGPNESDENAALWKELFGEDYEDEDTRSRSTHSLITSNAGPNGKMREPDHSPRPPPQANDVRCQLFAPISRKRPDFYYFDLEDLKNGKQRRMPKADIIVYPMTPEIVSIAEMIWMIRHFLREPSDPVSNNSLWGKLYRPRLIFCNLETSFMNRFEHRLIERDTGVEIRTFSEYMIYHKGRMLAKLESIRWDLCDTVKVVDEEVWGATFKIG